MFSNIASNAILYVPQGSKADYMAYDTNTTYTRSFSGTGSTTDGARIIESPATAVNEINAVNVIISSNNYGQIIIRSHNALNTKVNVYNIAGKLKLSDRLEGKLTVLSGYFTKGVYIVTIEENGNVRSEKVVVN